MPTLPSLFHLYGYRRGISEPIEADSKESASKFPVFGGYIY
jgi:hypothetical protein